MRKEQYFPRLCDRQSREEWLKSGAPDARQRARQKVHEILGRSADPVIPEETRRTLRREIEGLDTALI